jgi:hypothetical protein
MALEPDSHNLKLKTTQHSGSPKSCTDQRQINTGPNGATSHISGKRSSLNTEVNESRGLGTKRVGSWTNAWTKSTKAMKSTHLGASSGAS